MIYLVAILAGTAVTLVLVALSEMVPERPRALSRELSRLEQRRRQQVEAVNPRQAVEVRTQLLTLLRRLGTVLQGKETPGGSVRQMLIQAGYRAPDALTLFWGVRFALTFSLVSLALVLGGLGGADAPVLLIAGAWAAGTGWVMPTLHLRRRIRQRKQEILRYLPDALDLLVICVEAGLGLNQAIARMAEEIRHFSRITALEFAQVNLEIRAGSARDEALRGLGARTDLPELRALGAMLVQTDRFGTSVAHALRIHSDGLRTRWQQRMEEVAAKTTVKLVFPLVLCILPVLFLIILGPALIRMLRSLSAM